MAEYRTLRMTFWNDPYVENLGAEGRLFYLYLITCPYTDNLGFLEISPRRMAYETGLSEEAVLRLISEAEAAGKLVTDGSCLWLVNFIKHQASTSPKLVQSLRALLSKIFSLKIRTAVMDAYPDLFPRQDSAPAEHTLAIASEESAQSVHTVSNHAGNKKEEVELEWKGKRKKHFYPPSKEDVRDYCEERGNGIDADAFVDFYASKGWKVGAAPMKDWRAAVRGWEARRRSVPCRGPAREEENGEAIRRAVERLSYAASAAGGDTW